uniref:Uncharacterized protein n=1 Tax=Panagrolaimus superbus TaxID=310955 RepID=A0A914Y1L6_9BILA
MLNPKKITFEAAPQKSALTPQQLDFHKYNLEAQQKYSKIIQQVEKNQKLISEWIKNGTIKASKVQAGIEKAKANGKSLSPEALQKVFEQGQVVQSNISNYLKVLAKQDSENCQKVDSTNDNNNVETKEAQIIEEEYEVQQQPPKSVSESPKELNPSTLIQLLEEVKLADKQEKPKESDSKLTEELMKAQKQIKFYKKLAADQAESIKKYGIGKIP